ncbi:MAG: tetrahydrofolate dehydrogenase/cyclohydrolase catalytic domain-containing protein [Acidimicrobiales bacterium]
MEDDVHHVKLMPGGPVADAVFADLGPRIDALVAAGRTPGLGTILVGDDSASAGYIRMKMEKAQALGFTSPHVHLPQSASQADVLAAIRSMNDAADVDAVLLQHSDPTADRLRRRAARARSRQGRRRPPPGEHGSAGPRHARPRAVHAGGDRGVARALRDPRVGP